MTAEPWVPAPPLERLYPVEPVCEVCDDPIRWGEEAYVTPPDGQSVLVHATCADVLIAGAA